MASTWALCPSSWTTDPAYDISEEQRTALLRNGQWDCLLTTLDSVALQSPGVITAIIDETAGADQLWGRDVETINDLRGKRIPSPAAAWANISSTMPSPLPNSAPAPR
jgi:hypothetical protein